MQLRKTHTAGAAPLAGELASEGRLRGLNKSTLKADIYNQFLRLKMKLLLIMLGF
jgi:hypothetical protein